MEDKEVIRDSQQGFTKGKLCLTNLVAFCDEAAASVGKRKAMGNICIDFRKVFDTAFTSIIAAVLERYGFDRWDLRSVRNWLDGHVQRVIVNGSVSQVETSNNGDLVKDVPAHGSGCRLDNL